MRNLILSTVVLFATSHLLAQNRHYEVQWLGYQTGKFKFEDSLGVTTKGYNPNHLQSELYFLFEDRSWATSAPLSVIAAYLTNIYQKKPFAMNAAMVDFGWGWYFNRDSPIRIAPNADILIGMGFNLGALSWSKELRKGIDGVGVFVAPTVGISTQIGDRLHLHTILEIDPLYHPNGKGNRKRASVNISYHFFDKFSLIVMPGAETYKYKESDAFTGTTVDSAVKYKYRILKFGLQVGGF